MPKPNLWTTPIVGRDGLVTQPWKLFFQSLGVDESAPGSVSGILAAMQLLVANPLGQIRSLGDRGQQNFTLHGNPAGYPTWGLVRLGDDVSGNLPTEHLNGGVGADGTTFWRGDETWSVAVQEVQAGTNITVDDTDPNAPIVSSPAFAAPTGVIGFTAATGAATTVLRSDAAPALSNTLVALGTDSFSLSTASDLGDPAARGDITFTGGDNDTFTGSSLVVGGAGAAGGVLTATAGGAMTLVAGTTATLTAASLTTTTTGDTTLGVGGAFFATADAEIVLTATDEITLSTGASIILDAAQDFSGNVGSVMDFNAQGIVNFNSVTAGVRFQAATQVSLAGETGITLGINSALSLAEFPGEVAVSGRSFGGNADAKVSIFSASVETTDATPTEVETTAGAFIVLANDSSYVAECQVVARNTGSDTETAAFRLTFCIRRGANAGTTTVVGAPVLDVLAQDAGAVTWTCGVAADTTNGRPTISVTGEAAKNIRWIAGILMTKVSG